MREKEEGREEERKGGRGRKLGKEAKNKENLKREEMEGGKG